ncbi:cyclin-K [Aplysia californica]|uniref:Cyclin-K n=1 Tax=Aplysia californica TaxID=6500 RepID=A0ABM0JCW3_APLCA|nr:cyclin-K [Aplysia californica]XP_005090797.1 cyclin-K [Aplysia californica]XP_005090798.1 cyclin-K [Aplysia californica]
MPCWYFERREIKNSASYRDGIDSNTENRYRREGARFILDAGTKMGLRYDTCATGVVYFHRFYMFHSFKEFYRYVTAACCLFLAGKVEETPKKCKDIIKIAQSLLSASSFQRFGEDPREEVMTMERILLKTIKFDLQVEHPYGFLIKYLKYFKGEKEKTQKMAQMAWTFINDSLCTTLSLQWEPEIIAVSLMYLASRLTKFDPSDWSGRSSSKTKWWEDFVEGMSMELMEDICHQVLDLYSKQQQKKGLDADSPPQSPAKPSRTQDSPPPPPPPDKTPGKRSREVTPSEPEREAKSVKQEKETKMAASKSSSASAATSTTAGAPIPVAQHITSQASTHSSYSSIEAPTTDFNSFNPYVSSQMFSASFLSQEGSQNIQSILAGNSAPPPAKVPSYPPDPHHASRHPPPPVVADASQYPPPPVPSDPQYSYPPPSQPPYLPPPSIPPPHSYPPPVTSAPPYDPYSLPPNPTSYLPPSYPPPVTQPPPQGSFPPPGLPPSQYSGYPYPPGGHVPPPNLPPPGLPPPPHASSYPPPSSSSYSSHPPPGSSSQPSSYGSSRQQHRGNFGKQGKHGHQRKEIPSLTEIKISGRPEWGLPK